MIRVRIMVLVVFGVLAAARAADTAGIFNPPAEALGLLAESLEETCGICVEEVRKKAFKSLANSFAAGAVVRGAIRCPLVKPAGTDRNELVPACHVPAGKSPRIVFKFYTSARHLAGVEAKDYTDATVAAAYSRARAGARFEATLKLIPYRYGDGPTFNYFPGENVLMFHCAVIELTERSR